MQGPYNAPPEPSVSWQVQTFTSFDSETAAREHAKQSVDKFGGEAIVYQRNTKRGLRLRQIEAFGTHPSAGPSR